MAKTEHGFDVAQLKRLRDHLAAAVSEARDMMRKAERRHDPEHANVARGIAYALSGIGIDVQCELPDGQ